MLAENEIDDLELDFTPIEEPGYHNSKAEVDRKFLWLERWGVLPDELDRQDKNIVADIELRAAMKSQAQREYWEKKKADDQQG